MFYTVAVLSTYWTSFHSTTTLVDVAYARLPLVLPWFSAHGLNSVTERFRFVAPPFGTAYPRHSVSLTISLSSAGF